MILSKILTILKRNLSQKACAIDASLCYDRSEENRDINHEKDLYINDPIAFTGSLEHLHIDLGTGCWLTADAFESALLLAGSPLDSSVSRVIFFVGEDCKFMLEALARLLAISNQLVDAGKFVVINFQSSPSTLTYLNRIGFIDLLQDNVIVFPMRPLISSASTYAGNNKGIVELRRIDPFDPDDDIPNLLRNSFVSCAGSQYNVAAHTVISELFRNVKEHSGSTSAGFAALQDYRGAIRHHIQTVISDSGHGIVGTLWPILKDKYPAVAHKIDKSSLDPHVALLQEVFSKGGLSQVDDSSRGLGLRGASMYAKKYNAIISVRQETFELKVAYRDGCIKFSHSLELARIAGTHICFDLFLD